MVLSLLLLFQHLSSCTLQKMLAIFTLKGEAKDGGMSFATKNFELYCASRSSIRRSLDEGDCFSVSDVYFANAPCLLLLCNSNKWHLLSAIQLEAKSFACVCVDSLVEEEMRQPVAEQRQANK